jgi:hypothetical protein
MTRDYQFANGQGAHRNIERKASNATPSLLHKVLLLSRSFFSPPTFQVANPVTSLQDPTRLLEPVNFLIPRNRNPATCSRALVGAAVHFKAAKPQSYLGATLLSTPCSNANGLLL